MLLLSRRDIVFDVLITTRDCLETNRPDGEAELCVVHAWRSSRPTVTTKKFMVIAFLGSFSFEQPLALHADISTNIAQIEVIFDPYDSVCSGL